MLDEGGNDLSQNAGASDRSCSASIMASALSSEFERHPNFRVPGAGSRAVRRCCAGPFSADPWRRQRHTYHGAGTKRSSGNDASSLEGFFGLVLTKARLVESCGEPIPPAIYVVRFSPNHDSLFNLPASCREAATQGNCARLKSSPKEQPSDRMGVN